MSIASLVTFETVQLPLTDSMPALFLGHGSPMNAIEENQFVQGFRQMGRTLPKPAAIVCVSAHWETRGTKVTAMDMPRTIHDFWGFPKALYDVQYPAPGSPLLAAETQKLLLPVPVEADHQWGLDHGAWSVIKHMYPEADVPVIQLSIDRGLDARAHYELGSQLRALRKRGVLIVGSGNLVHNLRLVDWQKLNKPNHAYDWASEVRQRMNTLLLDGNHAELIYYNRQGKAFDLAIPTPEHYLPLLYILGLQEKTDSISLFNDEAVGGSLTMTSVLLNAAL
jgi:4,5-DOPA dioxygenase extradiol